ncbi:MAG: hypothetical protein Q7R70_05850 [Candidatus Diapherotrites archaeon]|nr:hypothetical protein [Candidatus Diapherotrites archaeon]
MTGKISRLDCNELSLLEFASQDSSSEDLQKIYLAKFSKKCFS